MSAHEISVEAAIDEVFEADFGDRRLNRRLTQIVARAAESPALSFPRMVATEAEKEAVYRFLGNDNVTWQKILAPHVAATAARTADQGVIRVVHDTTTFRFTGDREGLGHIMTGSRGFQSHVALAVSEGEARAPLGVLALHSFTRPEPVKGGDPKEKAKQRQNKPRGERESSRWEETAFAAHEALGSHAPRAIHIMDREANDYAAMALMSERGLRFVIRACDKRKLDSKISVRNALSAGQGIAFREVHLGRRTSNRPNRMHLNRQERDAKLHIRHCTVELPRPYNEKIGPARLAVNVVQVFEIDAPTGETPVCWTLFTNEPVRNIDEATAVVDHYRARWRVEEYFKALKTGCQFEKRQLETYDGLLKALAMFIPLAWRLLAVKTFVDLPEPPPATAIFTESQIFLLGALLKDKCKKILVAEPTVKDAMYAIAALGGHIRWNGPPGWQVLGRGFDTFVKAEAGWRLAMATMRCDQS